MAKTTSKSTKKLQTRKQSRKQGRNNDKFKYFEGDIVLRNGYPMQLLRKTTVKEKPGWFVDYFNSNQMDPTVPEKNMIPLHINDVVRVPDGSIWKESHQEMMEKAKKLLKESNREWGSLYNRKVTLTKKESERITRNVQYQHIEEAPTTSRGQDQPEMPTKAPRYTAPVVNSVQTTAQSADAKSGGIFGKFKEIVSGLFRS